MVGELAIPHRVHQRQLLAALIAVSYMGVDESGVLVGETVFDPGEEGGPGGAGVGHRPVGTSCFNSSNQLRTKLIPGASRGCFMLLMMNRPFG